MAISRIGASQVGTYNSQTGSISIDVPSGTDFVVICFSGYGGTVGGFRDGTLTLDGATMIAPDAADQSTSAYFGAMFYLVAPNVGTGKTLAWSWTGTQWGTYGGPILAVFYSGVDQSSPLRDYTGEEEFNTSSMTTKTLTAQSGDKLLGFAGTYSISNNTFSWTNATSILEATQAYNSDSSLAEADPTGNLSVVAGFNGTSNDGSISAFIIKPSSSAPVTDEAVYRHNVTPMGWR